MAAKKSVGPWLSDLGPTLTTLQTGDANRVRRARITAQHPEGCVLLPRSANIGGMVIFGSLSLMRLASCEKQRRPLAVGHRADALTLSPEELNCSQGHYSSYHGTTF